MTTLKIERFGGIAPRWSNRLLPPTGAVTAANAKLLSGELRGLRETQLLYDFGTFNDSTVARAYRLPSSVDAPIPLGGSDTWIGFVDAGVDFVRTPVLEDTFERYYWTGDSTLYDSAPQYNTRARIQAGDPAFLLGVPPPANTPTLSAPSGATPETRAYIFTFVSAYGEEGPPSVPVIATGNNVGTWLLGNMDATVPAPYDSTASNITHVRIYRTVPGGSTQATYFHVADITLGTTSYSDTADDAEIALNYACATINYGVPPATLTGLASHPGGFMMGFSGRDLWISQPYQPHAWPVENILTTQTEIVGLAVFNNTIIVTTTSHMYYAEGMVPSAITLQKMDSIDPCIARRSMAVTLNGVYYASPQGLVLADSSDPPTLITEQLFTREEWQNYFSPTNVQAVPYGIQYVAFDSTATGFIFTPMEQETAPLTTLDYFNGVQAIQIDAYSGDVYLIQANQVRLWDPPESTPYTYTWRSKEFDLPKPVNFGAFRLKFQGGGYQIPADLLADYTAFNTARFAEPPLNPINGCAINGVRTAVITGQGAILPQNRNPINGSGLWNLAALENLTGAVVVNIYARDENQNWNLQFTWTVTNERIYRLPAGFKSDGWQFEFIGNIPVYSFAIAETATELKQV